MSGIPAWLGATAGQATQAGQVNQFLGTHPTQYLYAGTLNDNQTTTGAGTITVSSVGGYLAQSFTTGPSQTQLGYVQMISSGGGTGTLWTVSIYASSGGAPTGSPLVTVTASGEYENFAPTWVTHPVPLNGLATSTKYFIVGHSSSPFQWRQSNQVSGAYTSSNGTTWTAQAYGMTYQIYDPSLTGPLTCTWEDSGARWTWLGYNGSGQINQLSEYTAAQNGGFVQADRNLIYSGTVLGQVA